MMDILRRDGVAIPHDWLTMSQVRDIFSHLDSRMINLGGHVTKYGNGSGPTTREFMADQSKFIGHSLGCYDLETAVRCPHLLETALRYVDLAEEYFEREPVIYSANIWWSFSGGVAKPEVQAWHRDTDDVRFLVMFFYLTSVGEKEAHQFLVGTHSVGDQPKEDIVKTITGDRGTFFFEDASGMHMGVHPEKRSRLAAWVRFGVSDRPVSYGVDGLHPVEHAELFDRMTEKERRITRLLVKNDHF